ncbi:2629_t:CDS:2 [Paraglomus brasilianum]|uniref:2629_t:CDS:1 n=1 Tax=Paraglomus brasilianum TaxID=144538 RepID=A0A9N8W6F2_9GLOM|nr:2629_t:CDS:2 [Paraglomus brasilianum]
MTQVQSILPGMRESAFNHFVKSFVRSAVSEITFFKSDNTPKDGVVFMRTETGALYACETIVILRPQHTSNSKQHNSNIKRGILLKDEDIEEDEDDKDSSEIHSTKSVSDRGSVASAETVPSPRTSPPPRKRPRYQKQRLASIRELCSHGMLERIQSLGTIAAQRKRQFTFKATLPTDEQLREAYMTFVMSDNRPKQYIEAARLHELVLKSSLTVRKQASVLRMGVGTWKSCKKQVARMAEVVKYCGVDLDEDIPPKTFWRVAPVKIGESGDDIVNVANNYKRRNGRRGGKTGRVRKKGRALMRDVDSNDDGKDEVITIEDD